MTKSEFLSALRARLYGLPSDEIDERMDFYGEAIDDRIEEGCSEEDAVGEMGSLDDIVFEIIGEVPLSKIIKERVKPKRRFQAWETVLLAASSPVWIALLAAAVAVTVSLYASLWAVAVSFWSAFVALGAGVLGGAAIGAVYAFTGFLPLGIAFFGAGVFLAGLAILAFFGSLWATRGLCALTRKMRMLTKRCFMGKGEAK